MAHKGGKPRDAGLVRGQAVRLLVIGHLQPVLQAPQIPISLDQLLGRFPVDVACRRQGRERSLGLDTAQLRLAAAPDQLLGLREELDLADAAAAQLDIVPLDGDLRPALEGVDLALDGMDVLERPEIEVLAPDEGAQFGQEGFADGRIARRRPRPDHGGALPVLAHAFVVGQRRRDRNRHRHGPRIGPEPQIGAEDVAVGGAVFQQTHEILGDAYIALLRAAGVQVAGLFRVEDHD